MYDHGRAAGTGYISILPVDQGIEHSAGASFAPNPDYFDPSNIVELDVVGNNISNVNTVEETANMMSASRSYQANLLVLRKAREMSSAAMNIGS